MEQNKRLRRSSRSAEEWSKVVDEWRGSGLSARVFAKQLGVGVSSLYKHWAGGASADRADASAPGCESRPRFLSVVVARRSRDAVVDLREHDGVEVVWPRGPVVRVSGEPSPRALASVLRALAEVLPC